MEVADRVCIPSSTSRWGSSQQDRPHVYDAAKHAHCAQKYALQGSRPTGREQSTFPSDIHLLPRTEPRGNARFSLYHMDYGFVKRQMFPCGGQPVFLSKGR